ncbi:MAG TPA: hypothetical protein DDZ55_03170 [Firmicutes bacterium]|nr:hypothetical protein [Bacillota bacterium]
MMEKEAWVVSVEGEEVRLRYLRHSACKNCGACFVLGNSLGEQEIVLPKNELDLKQGDRVTVGFNSTSLLRAGFLVYAVPLVLFLLGYLGGARLGDLLWGAVWAEVSGVIGGALALVLTYFSLHIYDRRLRKLPHYQPQITRVLERTLS